MAYYFSVRSIWQIRLNTPHTWPLDVWWHLTTTTTVAGSSELLLRRLKLMSSHPQHITLVHWPNCITNKATHFPSKNISNVLALQPVWPDWAIYWTLGSFLITFNLPKSPTFLGNFFWSHWLQLTTWANTNLHFHWLKRCDLNLLFAKLSSFRRDIIKSYFTALIVLFSIWEIFSNLVKSFGCILGEAIKS